MLLSALAQIIMVHMSIASYWNACMCFARVDVELYKGIFSAGNHNMSSPDVPVACMCHLVHQQWQVNMVVGIQMSHEHLIRLCRQRLLSNRLCPAGKLKSQCTMLVVSHDLRELSTAVDFAWHMHMGGKLSSAPWPPMPGSTAAAASGFFFQS